MQTFMTVYCKSSYRKNLHCLVFHFMDEINMVDLFCIEGAIYMKNLLKLS